MINNKPTLRIATKEDIDLFYPDGEMKFSVKAWVLEQNSNLVALGGLMFNKGSATCFVKTKESLPAKTFWRVSQEILKQLKELNLPMVAIRDSALESSERYLSKLGFKFYNIQNNQEVYRLWQN